MAANCTASGLHPNLEYLVSWESFQPVRKCCNNASAEILMI